MTIRVRYEFEEDRMRLEVKQGSEEAWQILSLNRRQWLNLIRVIGATELPPLKEPPQAPLFKQDKEEMDAIIQYVKSLGFKQGEDGLGVVFQFDDTKLEIGFPKDALPRIGELFFRQAEYAGWDPVSGLERLKASDLAREALKKVQSHG